MATTFRDALLDEVRDLYHAEKQLVRALPKLAKGATSPELRQALESHLGETEEQVSRLEQVFELLDERVRAKTCAGMAGIVEEGSEILGEDFEDDVMDAAIIAAAQRAEHYEMAAYGTAAAWAEALGLSQVASLLTQTLEEEKAADEKLSALAEKGINAAAASEEGEEDEDNESQPMAHGRREAASASGSHAKKASRANGGRR